LKIDQALAIFEKNISKIWEITETFSSPFL